MTERGIIFSAPMVRALLKGRKTQTRRLITSQPSEHVTSAGNFSNSAEGSTCRWSWLTGDPRDCDTWGFEGDFNLPLCIGDRLYVREHWKTSVAYNDLSPSEMGGEETVYYIADGALSEPHPYMPERLVGRHRQAMHMPRWASRLTLTVTDVRVQQLQDISERDAVAEGILDLGGPRVKCADGKYRSPQELEFRSLWNSLHTDPGTRWDDNPWIYALTFDVEDGNIDQVQP